ncbi:E3 ubiquitin-protein ligase RHA2A-like [Coffea arabica]|uniref:E3 ubiquitin-protein ligase RHA2A-like n=1 Tax=Coffea arabica TaxID=13443 RepID=A0A6P6V0T8_COFAR
MGLQNQLADISTESFPILMVALVANCVGYIRSILIGAFQAFGLSLAMFDVSNLYHVDDASCDAVGSGLTGIIMLAEQLKLNRAFSYRLAGDGAAGCGSGSGSDCVVCLNRLGEGDHVRKLACRHVFHKECFDGWLDHMNFNCPLCRMPLVADECVAVTKRRVTGDVLEWFSLR